VVSGAAIEKTSSVSIAPDPDWVPEVTAAREASPLVGIAPLALGVKLAYGAPGVASAAMAIPIAVHLTIFQSDEILLRWHSSPS
jgi:hypothetical protein